MSEARKVAKWDRHKGRPEPIRLLNAIHEEENFEPLLSLLEVAPSVKIIRPQVIPYLRKTVAEMLEAAAQKMPPGVHFGVIDAWRPFARQQRIYNFMWECAREAFPDRNDIALRRTVCRWVAPTDQKAPPGHCTGAAVDVFLVDDAGEEIDVCLPYTRWTASATYSEGLAPDAEYHRNLLIESMLSVGFSNCRDEWWHYSYGDAGWAVRMAEKQCQYGISHLPVEMYQEQERLSEEYFVNRANPFLPGA